MDPVQKALWYVESHSRESVTLDAVARGCKVSAFHLTRAFGASMGLSLMRYVRARRLTEAARQLARGAGDILAVALDAGYGSHEAFTRAFRDQFALTPEQVRSQGHCENMILVEAITMKTTLVAELEEPRFETFRPMRFAGLVERYDCQSPGGIPDQWQRFGPHIGRIPGQVDKMAYGVIYNFDTDGNFDYMCAVEVTSASELPQGVTTLQVPERQYIVFAHRDHIAGIRGTMAAIWGKWLPESGRKALEGPTFERYGPEFNPATGMGGLEIWIPIEG
jgi:AraC family transcriptional regulator